MSANAKRANIFLTGMMGTGKTVAGKLAARELGYKFCDTDVMIEASEGLSVRTIFLEKGEAYFRKREKEILGYVCLDDHQVVATGGGMLASADNLDKAGSNGLVVLLTAPTAELVRRLEHSQTRPLLEHPTLSTRLDEILKQRREIYSSVGKRVDTFGLTVSDVAKSIVTIYREWLNS